MFKELFKYKDKGSFDFRIDDNLSFVCNAHKDYGGVYLVYDTTNDIHELIYIGRSGKIRDDGSFWIRKGGIYSRIVKGIHKFPEQEKRYARSLAWPHQMKIEGIMKLRIEWFVTLNDVIHECPDLLERSLRKKYETIYGRLPRWNKE